MSRVFRRGELGDAVLEILATDGPSHGYAVLASLADRVAGHWRPSPGAVYPTLVRLQAAGLVTSEDDGDLQQYRITAAGRRRLGVTGPVLDGVRRRAGAGSGVRLAAVLDDFVSSVPQRSRRLDPDLADEVASVLRRAGDQLTDLLTDPDLEEQLHG